jgi:tetratricopeptide (TPR) repeat protein
MSFPCRLCSLLVLFVLFRVECADDSFVKKVQAAQELFQDKTKTAESMKAFEDIVAEYPDKPDGHHYLSLIYLRQEMLPEAENELQEMVKLNPMDVNTRFNLGMCLSKQAAAGKSEKANDKFQEAIDHFEEAINFGGLSNAHPKVMARMLLVLGNTYTKLAKLMQAEEDGKQTVWFATAAMKAFDDVLKFDPKFPDAANNKAYCIQQFGFEPLGEATAAEDVRERTSLAVRLAQKQAAVAAAVTKDEDEDEGVAM